MLNYIKESYKELVEKVSWPTFAQLQSSTIVVMVASLIFALVVLVMDISFENLMKGIYKFPRQSRSLIFNATDWL